MASYRLTVEGSEIALAELVVLAMQRGLSVRVETLGKGPDQPRLAVVENPFGGGGGAAPPEPNDILATM